MAQIVEDLPVMQETQVQSLGREDPLEKGMATHSRILAWSFILKDIDQDCQNKETQAQPEGLPDAELSTPAVCGVRVCHLPAHHCIHQPASFTESGVQRVYWGFIMVA